MSSSKFNRRIFIKAAIGGGILASVGGTWRAYQSGVFHTGEGPAYQAWKEWQGEQAKGPMKLVQAAILAANPHNSQPWLFHVKKDSIDLYADFSRQIGTIDPLRREMYIGLGCAIENISLAAKAHGYQTKIQLMPKGSKENHVAHIQLKAGKTTPSPLYKAIPLRATRRDAYDLKKPIDPKVLKDIEKLTNSKEVKILWFTTKDQKKQMGDVIVKATEAIIADKQQSHDSHRWMRQSWKELQSKKDGITTDVQGLPSIIRHSAKMMGAIPEEQSNQFWLQATKQRQVDTAAVFGLLIVKDNTQARQRLQGGRYWQAIHLWSTIQGLGVQPLNQPCERADREKTQKGSKPVFTKALAQLVPKGWEALMPFRMGYPTQPAFKSPRRPYQEVLYKGKG